MKKLLLTINTLTIGNLLCSAPNPNIVLMLADDFGYGSLNAYGAPKNLIKTPNMDSLAKQGIMFTNACTPSSVSSPTRYAVLTGRYPWRINMKSEVWGYEPLAISKDTLTLQRMLKSEGYSTACVGKWHLGYGDKHRSGKNVDMRDDFTGKGVNSTGFDYSFTIPQNHGDVTGIYMENDKIWGLRSNKKIDCGNSAYGPPYHGYDAPQRVNEEASAFLTQKAISWLKTIPKDKPFFLYFASPAVHEPITPSKKNAGKSGAGAYGDFILDLDDSVGELVAYLKKTGQFENTIFIFTSDNGAQHCSPTYDRTKHPKGGVPILNHVQDANRAGLKLNGDWSMGKTFIHEGGTRVPFILTWPGHIPAGKVSDQAFSLVDIMATIAHVVGYKLEVSNPSAASDSFNVFDIWQGKKFERPNIITASVSGARSIRNDGVKYVDAKPFSKQKLPGEKVPALYDLSKDPQEKANLAKSNPALAESLQEKLDEITERGTSRE